MSLVLLNLDSNQQIKLDNQNPLIIGRKNVEGCFDKRVSRNHGRVTCTIDGKLRLEALHFNPCFFTRNGVPPVLQLNKDEEETLSEGDYLGLLPNAFWFKITSDKVTKLKIRPDNFEITSIDQGSEENKRSGNLHDNRSVTNSEADKIVTIKVKDSSVPNDEVNEGNLNPLPVPTSDSVINSTGPSKHFGSEEFEKTRRLPLWMYEIYDPMEGNKSSSKRSRPSISEKQRKQKALSVAEIEKNSRQMIQVSGRGTDISFPSTSESRTGDKLPNTTPSGETTSDAKSVKCSTGGKIACEYGSTCYIKTSQHKAQFCHPGDEDYVPRIQLPIFKHSSLSYDENKEKQSFNSTSTWKSRPSQDEGGLAPHPLKRSRKRTKVHTENDLEVTNEEEPGASGNQGPIEKQEKEEA